MKERGRSVVVKKMKIALIEDDAKAVETLSSFLRRYEKEQAVKVEIVSFSDAVFFLGEYKPEFDCIFMDIDLPFLNGLDGAMKLREKDPLVPIVFVTSLAQYAIRGYEASAVDYLVKPYSYESFAMATDRAVARAENVKNESVIVRNMQGVWRIAVDSVYYVEVCQHRLLYHTDSGIVNVWGSMPDAERTLPKNGFYKCGASWLVNLRHVRSIEGNYVIVGDKQERLKISRTRKKAFVTALHLYIEHGGR